MVDLSKMADDLVIESGIGKGFAVEIKELTRPENHGRAMFQDAMVGKRFNDDLRADAVGVAAGNADDGFVHTNNSMPKNKLHTGSGVQPVNE